MVLLGLIFSLNIKIPPILADIVVIELGTRVKCYTSLLENF